MESGATSPTTDTVAMMTQQAEEQWRRAGGHVLPPFAPIACASRRAFALLQAAAALDQECARLRQELCELNTGEDATRRVRACVSPTSKAGAAAQQEMDDESDGSDLQGSLVAANVRPGKPLVLLSARDGLEHRAPDGSLRLVAADMLSEHEREQLLAGGLVAMAGAFSARRLARREVIIFSWRSSIPSHPPVGAPGIVPIPIPISLEALRAAAAKADHADS